MNMSSVLNGIAVSCLVISVLYCSCGLTDFKIQALLSVLS